MGLASIRKMNGVAESGKNWFESAKNMNWTNSIENWVESIENMDQFEIFKYWFEAVKNWFEEVKERGISGEPWNYIFGAGMVLLLVAAVICVSRCGCFCLNKILSVIRQTILFLLQCFWFILKPIGRAIMSKLRCCGVQLMRAVLSVYIPSAPFVLISPRIYFQLLRFICPSKKLKPSRSTLSSVKMLLKLKYDAVYGSSS